MVDVEINLRQRSHCSVLFLSVFVAENAKVEKVSKPGNVVPRHFCGLKFSKKVFKKILRLEENF